jgi:predicted dehydrogenase
MTTLTPEQRALGLQNANTALGVTRRDFLKAAAVAPALGAFYFGYQPVAKAVRAAIIGTGNEGCDAMIRQHNREYVNYIGFCDIRPSQQKRARAEFAKHPQYSPDDVKKLRQYQDADEMLADPDVEMVVIALPLWLHAPVAVQAMKAGKHVFCEKLMAHSVGECKQMCRVARDTNKLLAIGHQRHYSVLYDNANYLVQNDLLGEIRHIRALWHRNNAVPRIAKDKDGRLMYDEQGHPIYVKDEAGNVVYFDSWKPEIPKDDLNVDFKKYGYKSLDELIRWRLYNRTGAGLMAELGSHQLDACSIFLGKQHPIAVTGMGGTYFYTDGREVDDHVFVTFEFPGLRRPGHVPTKDERVIVTYSSITTNAFENYGEQVMGTKGTMIVEGEKELLLFKEIERNTWKGGTPRTTTITIEKTPTGTAAVIETSPSAAAPTAASSLGALAVADPSRGYREELEHFAYCVREGNASNYYATEDEQLLPRCRGEVALADAVIALTSNLAMREKRRIEFDPKWFDYASDEVPDRSADILAQRA